MKRTLQPRAVVFTVLVLRLQRRMRRRRGRRRHRTKAFGEVPMPVAVSYPGVYIEEVPSGVRTVAGVATSIAAFIGRAGRGPANEPVRVQSFAEFERAFGGLWAASTLGYA